MNVTFNTQENACIEVSGIHLQAHQLIFYSRYSSFTFYLDKAYVKPAAVKKTSERILDFKIF